VEKAFVPPQGNLVIVEIKVRQFSNLISFGILLKSSEQVRFWFGLRKRGYSINKRKHQYFKRL
jgi:hypothetical protein